MQDLELAIHHHQSLYEQVTQAYTEVRTKEDTQVSWLCVCGGEVCWGVAQPVCYVIA